MKKISIVLGRLVRQEKTVTVEVPDDFDSWEDDRKRDLMHEVYEEDEGDGFTEDNGWCCEEATHHLLGYTDKMSDYCLLESGRIERCRKDET